MKICIVLALFVSAFAIANPIAIGNIEQAANQNNRVKLTAAIDENHGYIKAFAHYKLAVILQHKSAFESATEQLHNAIAILEHLTTQNEQDSESWALLSLCYGIIIHHIPEKTLTYGQKSLNAMHMGFKVSPNNPRVLLAKGIIELNMPAMYGGSIKEASRILQKAVSSFENNRHSKISWGESEALIWQGLAYQSLGENDKALKSFNAALVVSPDNGWAQHLANRTSN